METCADTLLQRFSNNLRRLFKIYIQETPLEEPKRSILGHPIARAHFATENQCLSSNTGTKNMSSPNLCQVARMSKIPPCECTKGLYQEKIPSLKSFGQLEHGRKIWFRIPDPRLCTGSSLLQSERLNTKCTAFSQIHKLFVNMRLICGISTLEFQPKGLRKKKHI